MVNALARVVTRTTGIDIDIERLKSVLIFSGAGLLVCILLALTYGLDLSPGFF